MERGKATHVLRNIAANVRRVRRDRGLTQEELAELGPSFVQKVERGIMNLSIETLVSLAVALDVEPQELLASGHIEPRRTGRPPKALRAAKIRG